MDRTILPAGLSGTVGAIASKSAAHRLYICAALAGGTTQIRCGTTSKDIEATRACLQAMAENGAELPCGESGSTLRFLLPVVAALGQKTSFRMEGRLPQRPLAPLDAQLTAHGVCLSRPREDLLQITGQLQPGDYVLPGDVSSQYISGLLFALPLLPRHSTLTVTGKMESAPYIDMTLDALAKFGVRFRKENNTYYISPQRFICPGAVQVEGDWSNAAFWLCAGALSGPVTVSGLDTKSLQGDKAIIGLLAVFGAKVTVCENHVTVCPGTLNAVEIDASAIPDLVPVLSVVAASAAGTTRIYNAQRLRLKESDRIASVRNMLTALGSHVEETEDGLLIHGGNPLTGGTVDSCNDHRIAMAAAVASACCTGPVTVLGAEAVNKSYPDFWSDFELLRQSQ